VKVFWLLPLLILVSAGLAVPRPPAFRPPAAPPSAEEPDRSPIGLALSRRDNGRRVITANATAGTASLVDLAAGRVLSEVAVGDAPFAAALAADERFAVVTNRGSGTLSVLEITLDGMKPAATIPVGDEPRGVALAPDGRRAWVALAGEDAVAVVDLSGRRVVKKIPVGTEPWHLALTPDGKRLAVGNARGGSVTVVSAAAGEVLHTVRMKGRNLRGVAVSPDGAWAYVPHISERGFPATRDNIDRGWVVANRLGRVSLSGEGPREAIALDPRGEAVGDVDGAAVSPDGRTVAMTAGGTHELLLLGESLPFVAFGGPDDHIDPDLRGDGKRFRRVPLGGRPLGVAFAPDGKTVVVANYLGNALQVVDVAASRLTRTIPIGGPAAPSLARRGEAIFTDARRSFNQWYSCNTCPRRRPHQRRQLRHVQRRQLRQAEEDPEPAGCRPHRAVHLARLAEGPARRASTSRWSSRCRVRRSPRRTTWMPWRRTSGPWTGGRPGRPTDSRAAADRARCEAFRREELHRLPRRSGLHRAGRLHRRPGSGRRRVPRLQPAVAAQRRPARAVPARRPGPHARSGPPGTPPPVAADRKAGPHPGRDRRPGHLPQVAVTRPLLPQEETGQKRIV
jgi:YVTN family beta-propeller protein